jgi:hypothetical protein
MRLIRYEFIALDQVMYLVFDLFNYCGAIATSQVRRKRLFSGENLMPARFENKFNPTRRRLVLGVTGVLSFFGLGAGAALAAKASKASVGYRDTPKGDQNCANCILFISPNACKSVSGDVSANGWCRIWKA